MKTKQGLSVIIIDNKIRCVNCDVLIVNTTEWKKDHLKICPHKTIIVKAADYAQTIYKKLNKKYGNEPYFYHCSMVADIVKFMSRFNRAVESTDENLIAAAYLHDVLEDTMISYSQLKKDFNDDIANLVVEVTKDEYGNFGYLKTKRGLLLKCADRLANISSLSYTPPLEKERQEKLFKKYSIGFMQEGNLRKNMK